MIWDNASWHVSHRVRAWIGAHNRRARAERGVRIVTCRLPPAEQEPLAEPDRALLSAWQAGDP